MCGAFLVGCLSVLFVSTSRPATADELSDLEKAYSAYVAHQYDDAESRLRALLDPKSGNLKEPDRRADARMYLGAVLLAEGRKDEASAVFEELLLEKPDYQPDPLRVPLPALDAAIDARLRLRDRLVAIQAEKVRLALEQKARMEAEARKSAERRALLEKLASEEVVVDRHSRWEALLPFGVGQFQNRQPSLGWTFLTSEAFLAVGSAVSVGFMLYNQSLAADAYVRGEGTAFGYQSRAQEASLFANLFAGGFFAVALVGIVQAEAAFVPEHVEVRKRVIPPISLSPRIGPGGVGVAGTF